MSAAAAARVRKPTALPKVFAQATIECDGVQSTRPVELWEILPVGWGQASTVRRQEWLRDYFREELGLTPNQQLLKVEVNL